MSTLIPGQKVRHLRTGKTMTVKSIRGNIVTCNIDGQQTEHLEVPGGMIPLPPVAICKRQNLILV